MLSQQMKCTKNCSRTLLFISQTPLGRTIDTFAQDMSLLRQNPDLLQTFYDYVSSKYGIRCNTGLALVEKMVMMDGSKQ